MSSYPLKYQFIHKENYFISLVGIIFNVCTLFQNIINLKKSFYNFDIEKHSNSYQKFIIKNYLRFYFVSLPFSSVFLFD